MSSWVTDFNHIMTCSGHCSTTLLSLCLYLYQITPKSLQIFSLPCSPSVWGLKNDKVEQMLCWEPLPSPSLCLQHQGSVLCFCLLFVFFEILWQTLHVLLNYCLAKQERWNSYNISRGPLLPALLKLCYGSLKSFLLVYIIQRLWCA